VKIAEKRVGWFFELIFRVFAEVLFDALFHVPGMTLTKAFGLREQEPSGCLVLGVSAVFWSGVGIFVWWIV